MNWQCCSAIDSTNFVLIQLNKLISVHAETLIEDIRFNLALPLNGQLMRSQITWNIPAWQKVTLSYKSCHRQSGPESWVLYQIYCPNNYSKLWVSYKLHMTKQFQSVVKLWKSCCDAVAKLSAVTRLYKMLFSTSAATSSNFESAFTRSQQQ